MKLDIRKSLRRVRKRLKTACIAVALVTSWQAGQQAMATPVAPQIGDEVTLKFSGTIMPSSTDISHLWLIYGTGYSGVGSIRAVQLGDFAAGQTTSFSVFGNAIYENMFFWYVAGLYGDTSSGQYTPSVNGVTWGMPSITSGATWHFWWIDESTAFGRILSVSPNINEGSSYTDWNSAYSLETSGSCNMYNFSSATYNGTVTLNSEIVPEPFTILLLGTGGISLICRRPKKEVTD